METPLQAFRATYPRVSLWATVHRADHVPLGLISTPGRGATGLGQNRGRSQPETTPPGFANFLFQAKEALKKREGREKSAQVEMSGGEAPLHLCLASSLEKFWAL